MGSKQFVPVSPNDLRKVSQQLRVLAEKLVSEFIRKLKNASRDAKYIRQAEREINAVIESGDVDSLSELTADKVEKYLGQLREEGQSPRKLGSVVQSIKGFAKWAFENNRIQYHPLAVLRKPSAIRDRRLERRPFTREEWDRFIPVITGEVCGMPARARTILYQVAVQTGLRSSELRSLSIDRLSLKSEPAFVLASSGSTKNKQPARQYLSKDLSKKLESFVSDRSGPVFSITQTG